MFPSDQDQQDERRRIERRNDRIFWVLLAVFWFVVGFVIKAI